MCQDFHACQGCTWNVCKNRRELEVGLGLCKYVHACVCVRVLSVFSDHSQINALTY